MSLKRSLPDPQSPSRVAWRRPRRAGDLLLAAVLIAACFSVTRAEAFVYGYQGTPPVENPAADPAPTVFLAPGGNDANPCTAALPCKKISRGYAVAGSGAVVQMAAGTYDFGTDTDHTMSADTSKSRYVVVRPAPGAVVYYRAGLTIYASWLEIRDVNFCLSAAGCAAIADQSQAFRLDIRCGTNLTFRRVDIQSGTIRSADNVHFFNSDFGPNDGDGDFQIGVSASSQCPSKKTVPTNLYFEGNRFHDFRRDIATTAHSDCLQFSGGRNVTLRRNRFYNCSTQGLFIRSAGFQQGTDRPQYTQNFLIENNFLEAPYDGFYALRFGSGVDGFTCDDFMVRNNSLTSRLSSDCVAGGTTGVTVENNIWGSMRTDVCSGFRGLGYKVDYNLYFEAGAVTCGAHDVLGAAGYVNSNEFDYHLTATALAINRGNPNNFAPDDIDGQARPIGLLPDIGADEAGAGSPVIPPAPTNLTIQ
jgi:parallel beta helix pectate lyase-like protein